MVLFLINPDRSFDFKIFVPPTNDLNSEEKCKIASENMISKYKIENNVVVSKCLSITSDQIKNVLPDSI